MKKIIISTAVLSCILLSACKKKQPPANDEVPVTLLKVKERGVLYFDKYPSTTAALSQVNLLPQVQGAVTGIFFKEGSHVTKGQRLYEIDRSIYQAAYDQAVANLRVSQGTQKEAKQDADRYDYLNKYNAVAKQLYDHAVITYQNAKSAVQASEQQVKTARTNLGYSVVYAPFSGTIGFSQVKLGNVVSVGTTILNTISTDNPMAVDFIINEKQLPQFERLDHAKTHVDSLFTIMLPDGSLYPHTGKISVIDRAVDAQTGSVKVRLVFDNPNNELRAGMSCITRVHNQDVGPQIVVPSKAVVEQMGEYFVFIARDSMMVDSASKERPYPKKKALIVAQKKVQTGQTVGANVILKSGVKDGQRIVTDGVQTLHDGSKITTKNKLGPSGGKGRGR